MDTNPYSAPLVPLVAAAPTDAERIRQEHVKHESTIKTLAALHFISGTVGLVAVVLALSQSLGSSEFTIVLCIAVLAILNIFIGRGLRRFKPWARWAGVVVAAVFVVLSMVTFPVGPIINGIILYLLACRKSARIFAPDYQAIIAATPHVRHRTPVGVWITLGIVILLAVIIGAALALNS